MRYLIAFVCYSAHLHGDESGSIDRLHNRVGSRLLEPDPVRARTSERKMSQPRCLLDYDARAAVLDSLREVCAHRSWVLLAAHVRTNHVHVIVESEVLPEKILNDFKAYASRRLNILDAAHRRHWARHGSTRWLWRDRDVREAIRYVVEGQSEPMAVFVADAVWLAGPDTT